MNRLTATTISELLTQSYPGLFTHKNNLKLELDVNPNDDINTAGVYISRPDINNNLQSATLGFDVAVYDEEVVFDILIYTSSKNKKFDEARTAVESLSTSVLLDEFYSKTFVADETYNDTNIMVEYTFTMLRTVVKENQ